MPSEFRCRGKNLFITFPQCTVDKEYLAVQVKSLLGNTLVAYAIAQEAHEDGTPHLHCYISRNGTANITGTQLDGLTGKRGNYQTCRSPYNVLKYITKEDTDPLVFGIDLDEFFESAEKKKTTVFSFIAGRIKSGETARQINEDNPGFVLQHKRKLDDYIGFVEIESAKAKKLDWELAKSELLLSWLDDSDATPDERNIVRWLINNVRNPLRPLRSKCLWLWSSVTATGKTTFLNNLAKYLNIFYMPKQEEFYDWWENGQYDLIALDEFKGDIKFQALNDWAGGSTVPLRKKGAQSLKKDNTPIIILSNYSPGECYPKKFQDEKIWTTFMSRWLVIEVTAARPIEIMGGIDDEVENDDFLDYE